MNRIKSNQRRCPLLKHTKKEIKYDKDGRVMGEVTVEELNDCYGKYCMAWREKTNSCSYFEEPLPLIEGDLPDVEPE